MTEEPKLNEKTWTIRRRLMIGGAVAATATAWWGWPKVAPYFVGDFAFEALPGTPGLAHRVGGLEKEDGTGNVRHLRCPVSNGCPSI